MRILLVYPVDDFSGLISVSACHRGSSSDEVEFCETKKQLKLPKAGYDKYCHYFGMFYFSD